MRRPLSDDLGARRTGLRPGDPAERPAFDRGALCFVRAGFGSLPELR
jgi:hypothetical protein